MKKGKLTRQVNREIRRRADLFKSYMREPGPTLFFVLPGVKSEIPEGYCLTCGEKPVSGRHKVRCLLCGAAARIALEERGLAPEEDDLE